MAHSDALIFLTNITWIFFLFLFTYFFFVLFVLPTFYKKFRTRVLIKNINFLGGILSVRNVLVSLVFCVDVARGLISSTSLGLKKFFLTFNTSSSLMTTSSNLFSNDSLLALGASDVDSAAVLGKYKLNLLFVALPETGSVVFTRFIKS